MTAPQADPPRRIHHLRPLLDLPERTPPRVGPPRSGTSAITDGIVRLLRENTGRGPTGANTVISSDLAVVTLAECLTTAERTLADRGRSDAALELRAALHERIRADAIAVVESITGRPVVAYLAAQESDPDIAILAFYFGR